MVSPVCQIKEDAGSYTPTTNGFDATPGSTLVIRLADSNVDSWDIACITTDDSNDAATIQAGIAIDALNKTATLTAPAAGSALRFRSRVNGGIGPDGVTRPSYSTTFCIYTAVSGARVVAADETTEGSEFGWVSVINDLVRNSGGLGPAETPSAYEIDWSASGVFSKTLGAGAQVFTFANEADGQTIIVIVTGAASTLTWPTVKWAGGVAPTQTASGTDVYTFVKAGSTIYGAVVQDMN